MISFAIIRSKTLKKYLPLISQWMFCPFLRALVMPRLYWTTTLADLESTYTSTYASKCTAYCWSDLSGSIKRAYMIFLSFFSGVVVGTSLSKYLLEKSRIVFQVRCLFISLHFRTSEINWIDWNCVSFRLRRRETTMCFMSFWLGWMSGTSRIFTCKELKRTSTSTR